MDAVSLCGAEVPVSVWTLMPSGEGGQHCQVLMERVQRIAAQVSFSQEVSSLMGLSYVPDPLETDVPSADSYPILTVSVPLCLFSGQHPRL